MKKLLCSAIALVSFEAGAAQLIGSPYMEVDSDRHTRDVKFHLSDSLLNNPALASRVRASFNYLDSRLSIKFSEIDDAQGLSFDEFIPVDITAANRSYARYMTTHGTHSCNTVFNQLSPIVKLSIGADEETIRHELLHALGLVHEQQHSDRDTYIDVLESDINARHQETTLGLTEWDFNYANKNGCAIGKFDFTSTMLYHDRDSEIGRRHTTLEDQQAVIDFTSQNAGKFVRIRGLDNTDSARDNLTLNYEDGFNLAASPLASAPNIIPFDTPHLGAHAAMWEFKPVLSSSGSPVPNYYHIVSRWNGPNSSTWGGRPPILAADTSSGVAELELISQSTANLIDKNAQWFIAPWMDGIDVLNRGTGKALHIGNGQASLQNLAPDTSIIIDPVGPSLNPGHEPSPLDLLAVEINYESHAHLRSLTESMHSLMASADSAQGVTRNRFSIPTYWRFRIIKDTLGNVENAAGYVQMQAHPSGKYLHVNPTTQTLELINGADGIAQYGQNWSSSQWLIETSEHGEAGFILRNRLTGKPLPLEGTHAHGTESDRWRIDFSAARFFTPDS